VSDRAAFEYALLRIVPRIERGECLNAGVMLICRERRYLEARTLFDRERLLALAPYLDDDTIEGIERQLDLIPRLAAGDRDAGPLAALSQRERWHWLAAPASTIVQPGPVHTGICANPEAHLDRLFATMVEIEARR
jgi:hypothetical protein